MAAFVFGCGGGGGGTAQMPDPPASGTGPADRCGTDSRIARQMVETYPFERSNSSGGVGKLGGECAGDQSPMPRTDQATSADDLKIQRRKPRWRISKTRTPMRLAATTPAEAQAALIEPRTAQNTLTKPYGDR